MRNEKRRGRTLKREDERLSTNLVLDVIISFTYMS